MGALVVSLTSLVTLISIFIKISSRQVETNTKLDMTMQTLNNTMSEIKLSNLKDHERIFGRLEKAETRIDSLNYDVGMLNKDIEYCKSDIDKLKEAIKEE